MVLKFHMQHDEAAGLQNDKIQAGRESKMTTATKNSLYLKSTFLQNYLIYLAEILYRALVAP